MPVRLVVLSILLLSDVSIEAATMPVSDSVSLEAAINSAGDGDTVELASGNYSAPSGGFTIYNRTGGFTIRAANNASVTLTGNGGTDILRFATASKPLTFQGLSFVSGVSRTNFIGGAMTLDHVQANFVSCTFTGNSAVGSTTGGGALWLNESVVSLEGCTFSGNSSTNYGGAVSVLNSNLFVSNSHFTGNRCDVPNHKGNAAGGAILIVAGTDNATPPFTRCIVRISNSAFDSNRAGYVGGALYSLGQWQDPQSTPAVDLTVTNSLFSDNAAARDPSVSFAAPSAGGAVHVEDQTTSQFFNCRFFNNQAKQGGAISSYRAVMNFQNTIFRGNTAVGAAGDEAVGGAIIAQSADNVDSSTAGGTTNRRSAILQMTDCLVQGDGSTPNARDGGGVFVAGDLNAQFGQNGIRANSSIDNRGQAVLTRVAFDKLVVSARNGTPAAGGAVMGDFANITINSSIVSNCSAASGPGDWGGAGNFARNSATTINNSTLAHNQAASLGGAIVQFGGILNMTNDNLVDNSLTSGSGGAMTTAPQVAAPGYYSADQPIIGLVQNCTFSNNSATGAIIYDGDRRAAPFNGIQYSANTMFPSDTRAYKNDNQGRGLTVEQLNSTVIAASGVTKAPKPNTALTASATVGVILLEPPLIFLSGGPGEQLPLPVYVAYAASGGTASVDGAPQRSNAAVAGPTKDSKHTLTVNGQTFTTTSPQSTALNLSTRLPVGTGENALIGGFIIGPRGSSPKRVLIRAIGPSVPVAGALQDPVLSLVDSSGTVIANNDNWRTTLVGGVVPGDQAMEIAGTGAAPNGNESAIIATLSPYPQTYSAVVRGAGNTTGTALVEIFDLDAVQASRLANISTRGFVQAGDNVMIGGFIYAGGAGSTTVVLRALGPSLTSKGVANALADPTLDLVNSQGTVVATNDDWASTPNAAGVRTAGLAPADAKEAAIFKNDLPRGAYTAIMRGKNGGTGLGLVEVYVF
jgi:hypothetical protein